MTTTRLVNVNPQEPEQSKINEAAEIIRQGGIVAFPTETVYGLGANALDEEAVQKVFKAKGRPVDNPLIVHIAEVEQVYELAEEVPLNARRAMEAFWPGPLTIVLPCKKIIPQVVTGGLDTVAVRMPSHPVALALLKAARLPVAAPSANSSGKPSPTEAGHVVEDLAGKIALVLDGGAATVGLESTVLDMTGDPPVILRPGGIPQEQLEAVLGHVDVDKALVSAEITPRSPGMKYRHYSPRAPLILVKAKSGESLENSIIALVRDFMDKGKQVAVMASRELIAEMPDQDVIWGDLGSRENLAEVAASLFRVLRYLDTKGPDIIIAEGFPEQGLGKAIMNRLSKASIRTED